MPSDTPEDNRILALYRRFLGEPEREIAVYLGFALFFGGVSLGLVGLAVFLWSGTLQVGGVYWQLREIAITFAMLGLPAFVLSIVVLLPVGQRVRFAAATGGVLCIIAAGMFIATYPSNWNVQGTDYSAYGISTYAAGLAILAAASGAGIVGHHVERAGGAAASEQSGEAADEPDAVSDAQVRRDIEEAVAATDLTWGGVERDETRRLTIETDEESIDTSAFSATAATTARGRSVDDAVGGLRKLQGRDRTEETSDGVDEQTEALQRLREQQAKSADSEPESWLTRVRSLLGF